MPLYVNVITRCNLNRIQTFNLIVLKENVVDVVGATFCVGHDNVR